MSGCDYGSLVQEPDSKSSRLDEGSDALSLPQTSRGSNRFNWRSQTEFSSTPDKIARNLEEHINQLSLLGKGTRQLHAANYIQGGNKHVRHGRFNMISGFSICSIIWSTRSTSGMFNTLTDKRLISTKRLLGRIAIFVWKFFEVVRKLFSNLNCSRTALAPKKNSPDRPSRDRTHKISNFSKLSRIRNACQRPWYWSARITFIGSEFMSNRVNLSDAFSEKCWNENYPP